MYQKQSVCMNLQNDSEHPREPSVVAFFLFWFFALVAAGLVCYQPESPAVVREASGECCLGNDEAPVRR